MTSEDPDKKKKKLTMHQYRGISLYLDNLYVDSKARS
jgi:hypothetical protein